MGCNAWGCGEHYDGNGESRRRPDAEKASERTDDDPSRKNLVSLRMSYTYIR
jgi:hypothetical protein